MIVTLEERNIAQTQGVENTARVVVATAFFRPKHKRGLLLKLVKGNVL
jgi:hypothetical protein